MANELRDTLRRERLGVGTVRREGLTTVVLVPSADAPLDKVHAEIAEYPTFQIEREGAGEIRLQMLTTEADRIRTYAVNQGLETIRNRIDQFGVAETTVAQAGTNRILVEPPSATGPARAS
jgi:preprotein translocase subunit SecD